MPLVADRYKIVGLLGGGAMAEVYEVVDVSRGTVLALKRLLPERMNGRAATLLLQREFETLTQLSHPLIIRAFTYGIDGGLPFYTMERLSGQALSELAPLRWRTVAALLRDVASALSLVHSRKLVHRDVSSRNVCRTDDGRAKLIDFGALAPMGPPREIIGTPPFLCPEALELRPLDARADLFSLGALGYFSLTGRHAYPARRIGDLGALWSEPVAPPSSIVADVPAGLDALVLSLIDLNPLVRPGSAAEVCDRLTALAGLPTAEAPEVARAYFLTPKLVARNDETTRFHRRLSRAEHGRGGALLIESPRGGGRTRLLSSFLLEARLRGAVVVSADGRHGAPRPFGVVRALARSLRDTEPALSEQLVEADPELASVLGLDAGSIDGEGAAIDPEAWIPATERVTRWFVEASRKRPVVVGIDELDASDGPSAAIVAALSAAAGSEALLVVGTSVAGSQEPAALRLRESGHSVVLKSFAAGETRELVSSVFGDVPHLDEVAGWVHRLSEGLPRTALDLAQHLVDSGLARYGQGGWRLPASLEGLDLPSSVDAALDARIAALGSGARRIAEALSLTSSHDPLLAVEYAELLDEETKRDIFSHLNELVSASVLVDAGQSFVFASREIRAAVLRHVPREALAGLHLKVARAYGSGPNPVGDVAAYHLLCAGDAAAAFRLMSNTSRQRTDLFTRGMSFFRTSEGAETIERLYQWGREHGAVASDLAPVARALLQLASMGDARLARHAPGILETLRRDSGLDVWAELSDVADPLERMQRAMGIAYERHANAPDREQRLDPGTAIRELATAAAPLAGVYARNADHLAATMLDELVRPLRVLSPALVVLSKLIEVAARTLRGASVRDLRVDVIEQTKLPVQGIDEASRVAIQLMSLYYLALEDVGHGYAVPDERLSPLDGFAPYAPLAWQARMLREYYRGDERKAEACRRRRDIAMTGRADIDGNLETSVLYEATAYASLGNLMALKPLVPVLEERSLERPGWRPHYHLAAGNYHLLRGDHASAAEEYERGLSLPNVDTHAGYILLLIRAARCLVELGRFDAAREKAQAGLARHAVDPLMALNFDQLELVLARAEAGLGDTEQAMRRARGAKARVEERGVTGVVLVNFLVELAALAQQVKDTAMFDALTERVGTLVSGADSTALATQYARLASMRRAAVFEPVSARTSGASPATVYTALASSVRTELEACKGPSERSRLALQFLMDHSRAARGFLYVYRSERFELAASIPYGEPTETLAAEVVEWVRAAFASEGMTTTASAHEVPADSPGSPFFFVELLTNAGGEVVLAGVAALAPSKGPLSRVPNDVLRTVSEELLRTGDASGKSLFTKSDGQRPSPSRLPGAY